MKGKIITVTLNPAIDIRYNMTSLQLGKVNRTEKVEKNAGGKGVNVSRVLSQLGSNVIATGVVGGYTGELFTSKLEKENIVSDFLKTAYETRTCIAIVSNEVMESTEILEAGEGNEEIFYTFLEKYKKMLEENVSFISASGSLLKGFPKNAYRYLIEEAAKHGIPFILDTSGEALIEGMEAKPFLVKPNLEELQAIMNESIETIEDIINSAQKLLQKGIENIMVTLAKDGALLVTKENIFHGKIPKVTVKNTVGSGDSSIAGMIHALSEGKTKKEAFRFALACGTTNAMLDTTGSISTEILEDILGKIEIQEL